jgi:glycosyltransferase involved in cell wall biosynthesis
MRGFWADERVDGKIWDTSKRHYKTVYNFFKKKEKLFLSKSDAIVSLTNNGKKEMIRWNIENLNDEKISVIPCVADYNHFKLTDEATKQEVRKSLKINESTKVISYVGSLGTWYLDNEMMGFYKQFKLQNPDSIFLILTPEPAEIIYDLANKNGLDKNNFIIKFSSREELPNISSIANLSLFFIKDAYSKKSSSPTKMGELLAMGIPIICNNIGDVKEIVKETNTGICIENLNDNSYIEVINNLEQLYNKSPNEIRENSKQYFLLENGLKSYASIYKTVLNNEK